MIMRGTLLLVLLGHRTLLPHVLLSLPAHDETHLRPVVGANATTARSARAPSVSSSITMGGSVNALARAVIVGSDGNISVVGTTTWSNLPTVQPAQLTFAGSNDVPEEGTASAAFVAKLDSSGTNVVYTTYLL